MRKKPDIITESWEEEHGKLGQLNYFKIQKVIHKLPLGFSPKDNEKVRIATRVIQDSMFGSGIELSTYTNKNGEEECCFVYKAERSGQPPSRRYRCEKVNLWMEQTTFNMWNGALDPYPLIHVWQKLTRALGRLQYGYITR